MKGIRNVSGTVLLTADGQTTPAVAVDATGKLLVSGAGGGGSAAAVRNDGATTDQAAANGADSKIAVDIKGRAFVNNLDGTGNALVSTTGTPANADRGLTVATKGSFAEDAPATSGDVGFNILSVRNDGVVTPASATGDYQSLSSNSHGSLRVTLSAVNDVSTDSVNDLFLKINNTALGAASYGSMIMHARNDKAETQRGNANNAMSVPSMDQYGRSYVSFGVGPQEGTFFVSAVVSTLGNNTLGSAFGAGVRWYVTEITWENQDGAGHNNMTLSDGTTVFASATVGSNSTVHMTFQQPRRTAANGTFTLNLANARSSKVTIGGYTLTV